MQMKVTTSILFYFHHHYGHEYPTTRHPPHSKTTFFHSKNNHLRVHHNQHHTTTCILNTKLLQIHSPLLLDDCYHKGNYHGGGGWNIYRCDLNKYRGGGSVLSSSSSQYDDNRPVHSISSLKDLNSNLSSSYYLLSSWKIWKQIIITAFLLFVTLQITSSFILPPFLKNSNCHHHQTNTMHPPFSTTAMTSNTVSPLSAPIYHNIRRLWNVILLPLLSSACCSLQLIINILSTTTGIGCVGFNTKLGPLRPYFVSILLFQTISSCFSLLLRTSSMVKSPNSVVIVGWKKWIIYSVISWGLALLPEIIHWSNIKRVNHYKNVSSRRKKRENTNTSSCTKGKEEESLVYTTTCNEILPSNTTNNNSRMLNLENNDDVASIASTLQTTSLILDIPTMGCVACIRKIDTTIQNLFLSSASSSHDNTIKCKILNEQSWLSTSKNDLTKKGGKALITIQSTSEEETYDFCNQIVMALGKNGFPCQIESLKYINSDAANDA